ncbi:MAG: GTPase [Candidatus Ranarchaeia archaeon]
MPTNLPPEAMVAGKRYEESTTLEEKIRTLQDYLSKIPKHKGTGKLRLKLRGTLAKFEGEVEKRAKHKKMIASGGKSPWSIEKQETGLVILVGLPNSGKSHLLNQITGANSEVGEYEFTTNLPVIGATKYEDVILSIVDLPSIVKGSADGRSNGRRIFGVVRTATLIVLVCDLSKEISNIEIILEEFEKSRIKLNEEKPKVRIEKTGMGGIHVFGRQKYVGDIEELKDLLRGSGITNGVIHIHEEIDLEGIIDLLDPKLIRKKAIIVGSKGDLSSTKEKFDLLVSKYKKRFPIVGISITKNKGFNELRKTLFDNLDIIRVYTKEPGNEPTSDPLILKHGSTVRDICNSIHKTFVQNFKYAKIFGKSVKFDRTKVGLDHVVKDKDVVELKIK